MKPYYQDKWVTIYHGDCREILPQLPDNSVDLVLTDPPYGIELSSGWNGHLGDCHIEGDRGILLRDWIINKYKNKPMIIFGSWKLPRPHNTKAILIWDKGGHAGMGDLSFPWKPNFEEIYILGEGFRGTRTSSILSYFIHPTFNAKRQHPTEKPVALICHLISKCPKGIILDPFLGSGTIAFCAKKLNRYCIGIEIEEKYCEIAANRCRQEVMEL